MVVIGREVAGEVWFAWCEGVEVVCEYEDAAATDCEPADFCTADWARKAARKPEKKGLFDDMVSSGGLDEGRGLCRTACISGRKSGRGLRSEQDDGQRTREYLGRRYCYGLWPVFI